MRNQLLSVGLLLSAACGVSPTAAPTTYYEFLMAQNCLLYTSREIGQAQNYSEETARVIDDEVKRIVMEQYSRAHELLTTHLEQLKRLADALLTHETLSGDDVDVVFKGGTLPDRPSRLPRSTRPEATAMKAPASTLLGPPVLTPEKA